MGYEIQNVNGQNLYSNPFSFLSFEFEYSVQDLSLNLLKLILYSLNLNNVSYLAIFWYWKYFFLQIPL
jgi:hypothetical protein